MYSVTLKALILCVSDVMRYMEELMTTLALVVLVAHTLCTLIYSLCTTLLQS